MRQHLKTHVAVVALGLALTGCSSLPRFGAFGSTETPPPAAPADFRKSLALGVPSDVDAALRLAQAQRKEGNLDAATRTVSQLVLIAPDDHRVLGEYGKTLVAKGQSEDALAFLSRAIELQPNEWSLYSAQGVAYDQQANYTAAHAAYSRALSLNPTEPSVLSNAALSQMQAGNLAEAESLLLRASQHGGDNPRVRQNLTYLQSLTRAKASVAATAPAVDAEPPNQAEAVTLPSLGPVIENSIPAVESAADTQAEPTADVVAVVPEVGADDPVTATAAPAEGTVSAVAALAADPTVVMQSIPKPEPARATAAAKKPVAKRPAVAVARPGLQRQAVAKEDDGLRRLRPAQ